MPRLLSGGAWGKTRKKAIIISIQPICLDYPADWTELTIYPVYDVHIGSPEYDELAFKEYLQRIMADPRGLVILGGDLINNDTKGSVGSVYAATMQPMQQKKQIVALLEPIKDRIIAVVDGNHEFRTFRESGQDITYDICAKLNIEDKYRENTAFIKISLGRNSTHSGNGRKLVYTIMATHGSGGGMYLGGTINKTENYLMAVDGVDILITGHAHKIGVTRPAKVVFNTNANTVTVRDTLNVVTGSWMDWGGYAQRKLLRPGSKGATFILLDGTKRHFEAIV